MKGDFSKNSFDPKKHFHDVLMQQGRVLLDADWNEQAGIAAYRTETGTLDIIGTSGAPIHTAGFDIVPANSTSNPPVVNGDLTISRGRFYINGILCENEADVSYANQPDHVPPALPTTPGRYVFYLDTWLRHITVAEDDTIREVALGGPDTTTRTKTVWQVKHFPLPAGAPSPYHCLSTLPADVTMLSTGTMSARSEADSVTKDPCGLVTSGGYKRLENQLYRVEIHTPGDRSTATFKWSRDNAAVIVKWESQDPLDKYKLTVSSLGRDEVLGFATGNWVELIDDATELMNTPGILVRILTAQGNVLTLDPDPANIKYPPGVSDVQISNRNPRIRRWDTVSDDGYLKLNTTDVWIPLEEGVQVKFEAGSFKTGDYWTIPARTAKADVEWPFTVPQLPQGIKHHFAQLAILDLLAGTNPGWKKVSDCRNLFPPLTELLSFFYLGGDGQEARPGHFLADQLITGVANGEWPVKNARVKFTITDGGGKFDDGTTETIVNTSAAGVATCKKWKLGDTGVQHVKASLLDAAGNAVHLPITFNAKITPPALFYISGDGQEEMPGGTLPVALQAGVAYEQFPVPKARVKFDIIYGGGKFVDNSISSIEITGPDGIATSKKWILGNTGIQQVKATLLDSNNLPIHLPIIFTANLSTADKVFYDGGDCLNWPDQKPATVADALTALCKRTSGKGCSVTVGIEGNYPDLNTAFKALEKQKAICICLMPDQDHIAEDLVVNKIDDKKNQEDKKTIIKITGCGARIIQKGKFALRAHKIILEGFILETPDKQDLILLESEELHTNRCTFIRKDTEATLYIRLSPYIKKNEQRLGTIHWNDNTVDANGSLALAEGVEGWITNNRIRGLIILQHSDKSFPLKLGNAKNSKEKIESVIHKMKSMASADSLYIHGNSVNKIVTNSKEETITPDSISSIRGYRNLIVSENVINDATSSFIADTISLIDNQFRADRDTTTALLLGHDGMITGNTCSSSSGPIETMFDPNRKIISANLANVV